MAFSSKSFNDYAKKALLSEKNDEKMEEKSLLDNEDILDNEPHGKNNEGIQNEPDNEIPSAKNKVSFTVPIADKPSTSPAVANETIGKTPTFGGMKKPGGWAKLRQLRDEANEERKAQENITAQKSQQPVQNQEQQLEQPTPAVKESPWKRLKEKAVQPPAPPTTPQPEDKPEQTSEPPKVSGWGRLKQQNQGGDKSSPSSNGTQPSQQPIPAKASGWGRLKQNNGATTVNSAPSTEEKVSPWSKVKQTDQEPKKLTGDQKTPSQRDLDGMASAAYAVHATQKVTGILKEKAIERVKLKQKLALRDRMKKLVQERLTVRQIFRRYVETSTLHGFFYVASDTFLIRRVIWALLMIAGAIYFMMKLKDGVLLYLSYPFTTKTSTNFERLLDFPAISFCPINQFKEKNFSQSFLDRLNKEHGYPLSTNWTDPGYDIPGQQIVDELYARSFRIEDLVHYCDFVNRDTSHPEIPARDCGHHNFTSYISDHGEVCFTVNSGLLNHPMMQVTDPGLNYGYELQFDLRSNEAVINHPYNGIQVIIHHQDEPQMTKTGFILTTGAKSFVRMDRVETHSLPPPYSTKCGKKTLKYFKKYNQNACLLELLTDFIGEKCNCRQAYMPDSKLPYCSLEEEINCAIPSKESFDAYEMRSACPVDCVQTSFKIQVTDSRFLHNPPKGYDEILIDKAQAKGKNKSHLVHLGQSMNVTEFSNHIEDSILNVIFYYNELKTMVNSQKETFSFYKFLGDAGGVFGLMLGASLLTFIEFLDLVLFLLYHQLLRLHTQKKSEGNHEQADEASEKNGVKGDEKKKKKEKNGVTPKGEKKKKKSDENEMITFA